MDLIEYPDAEMLAMRVADRLATEIRAALDQRDHVSIAVPGGSTPGPIFDVLCDIDLGWDRVHVLLTDERRVPPDHERSNERLVRQRLLTGHAASARFVRLVPEDGETADDLAARIAPELPLTILILGMGGDMHCASLFAGSPQLDAALGRDAPPVMEVDAPEGLEPRLTLTAPVLLGAMRSHIVITGVEKREALARARKMKPHEAPVAALLSGATVHWAEE